ncbi:DUF7004 family protein [Patiriisocius hiemis]|uniref:Uncharacterized protein n=1 Tax=Patiriisocius hiemis TaxID=3075604 RepID=A0ABU2Y902_9FLAO|nr:hypothetical protein [Constantimarinum sp. W242]MDT0554502.1 hypothetical protein [Constantimarinum sp. W242]
MARLIKGLKNNRKVVFDAGKFDDWCVYVVEENGSRKAPFDIDYFTDLKTLSAHYIGNKVYDDFVTIYNLTTKSIDANVINQINKIVITYQEQHQIIIEQWLTVLYAGMIAEENKQFAILKKRVKRLGMHQVLIENLSPSIAANFSKGKKWRELDAVMKPKGF